MVKDSCDQSLQGILNYKPGALGDGKPGMRWEERPLKEAGSVGQQAIGPENATAETDLQDHLVPPVHLSEQGSKAILPAFQVLGLRLQHGQPALPGRSSPVPAPAPGPLPGLDVIGIPGPSILLSPWPSSFPVLELGDSPSAPVPGDGVGRDQTK